MRMETLKILFRRKPLLCLSLKVCPFFLCRIPVSVTSPLDGSKVEAQTPDGTRVTTPNAAKQSLLAMARSSLSTRSSYAAALKTKPTDWHLEFSMDDHILPLDLTIYGAIHQHEMRKKNGATPLNMIWQGVYTIKFKKVAGPAPTPEGTNLI